MLQDDINAVFGIGPYARRLVRPPPPPMREPPPPKCELLDLLVCHHEAGHAVFAYVDGARIHDVSVEADGSGRFRHIPEAIDLSDNPKREPGTPLADSETARVWLRKLVGFAAGRAAGRRFGAGPAYDYMAADDYRTIHFVLDAITKDPGRKRQHLIEIEQQAKEFVDRHWNSITRVANAMFEAPDHRLDRRQIERVLASPKRSAPEGEGLLDGVVYRWRQDGWIGGSRAA